MNVTVETIIGGTKEWEYTIEEFDGYISRQGNSWEICHNKFKQAKEDIKAGRSVDYDTLALHLGFYLASWGMYRGSSFLKALDYRIHVWAVRMMLEEQYEDLFNMDPFHDPESYHSLLFDAMSGIYCRLDAYYGKAHKEWPGSKAEGKETTTDTLITKILLGVYGCIPAYDVNFKAGIACFDGVQALNEKGKAIWIEDKDTYYGNKTLFCILKNDNLKNGLKVYADENKIPFMKAVDMYFFGLGDFCIRWNAEKKAAGAAENAREEIAKELEKIQYIEDKF